MYADLSVERKFKDDYGISDILKLVRNATSVATVADLNIWKLVRNVTSVASTAADKRPPKFLHVKFSSKFFLFHKTKKNISFFITSIICIYD